MIAACRLPATLTAAALAATTSATAALAATLATSRSTRAGGIGIGQVEMTVIGEAQRCAGQTDRQDHSGC